MKDLKKRDISEAEQHPLQRYYRFHAAIYDMTRWSFLFGRDQIIRELKLQPGQSLLEIGCGTGKNLEKIKTLYPGTELYGIDLSEHMLQKASEKLRIYRDVELVHGTFGEHAFNRKFDLVLCSYMLSMTGSELENILQSITQHLHDGGQIAVADFHHTRLPWFELWMQKNHVSMSGNLTEHLCEYFTSGLVRLKPAYGGIWKYVLFTGEKHNPVLAQHGELQ